MSAHATKLRRALRTAADALADFLEAEAAQPASEAPTPSPDAPNHDVARAYAARELKKRGIPLPKRSAR